MDYKFEVTVVPVSDVDRAKGFYHVQYMAGEPTGKEPAQ
jgi:hypothetical protein